MSTCHSVLCFNWVDSSNGFLCFFGHVFHGDLFRHEFIKDQMGLFVYCMWFFPDNITGPPSKKKRERKSLENDAFFWWFKGGNPEFSHRHLIIFTLRTTQGTLHMSSMSNSLLQPRVLPGAALLWRDRYIIWMFPKIVVPQNGWFIREIPLLKWMIWGYHYFRKHPYSSGTTVDERNPAPVDR